MIVPDTSNFVLNVSNSLIQELSTQTKDDLHKTERLLRHYQADPLRLSSRNPFDDDLSDESIEAFIDRTFEQDL